MVTVASPAFAEPTAGDLHAALSGPEAFYEIVEGRIVEVPGMSLFGGVVAGRIAEAMNAAARPGRVGFAVIETLFLVEPARGLRRRPDVAFVSVERWPLDRPLEWRGDPDIVPDLVVEILSPNDLELEVAKKRREYFRLGVRQVWNVRPEEREIVVYRSPKQIEVFEDGDILENCELLPGLRLILTDLFRTSLA